MVGQQAGTTPEQRRGKPVLLTVDDDPSVSRAVARDLRRRYAESYRVVRAESGPEALDTFRELVLRGEEVALLMADYRMPRMNGIEFLEQAMDLVPQARRCLLTAYADTSAAIAAINVVDVDHYLLKPWEPPEEKFYPVIDDLLATWRATSHPPVPQIKILGHPWSPASYEVRDFLARSQVPYRWYNVGEADGQRLLSAAGAEARQMPVVITSDGTPLVQPTLTRLAESIGLYPTGGHLVKRVIGVGGDEVACCDAQGRMTVNGTPLDERSYLAAGERPSLVDFDTRVRHGYVWVQGDNRSDSADSRAHLGDPGGGQVPVDDLVGKVFAVVWPLRHATTLSTPATFSSVR